VIGSCLMPSEKMPRDQLLDLQMRKLRYQLEYVHRNSSFYRRLFDDAGIVPSEIRTREDLLRIPYLDKEMLVDDQKQAPPYGTRCCVPPEKVAHVYVTGGTSGLGQEVYANTKVDLEWMGAGWLGWFWRAGLRKGDAVMQTLPISTTEGPLSLFQGFRKAGINAFHVAPYDTKTKIEKYMLPYAPKAICAVPAYLTHMTVVCSEMGIDPKTDFPKLDTILTFAEPFSLEWVAQIEETWGAKVHEMYGSSQTACFGSGTCENGVLYNGERGLMHFDELATLIEVVDPETGSHVEHGGVGEAVVTNLNREGTVLVRFKSGDRVRYMGHQSCDCGRTHDGFEAGTIARFDDMMKIKGVNVWPEAVDAVVFGFPDIEEYHGRVWVDDRGREQVTVQVEFRDPDISQDAATTTTGALAAKLREKTSVRMDVEQAEHGSLERFIMKVRRWDDERREGLERVTWGVAKTSVERSK
jgi:phenylacetate-CoA ligase